VRSVKSVLAQTLEQIEVIVVIDGPHEPTYTMLAAIDDCRLRVIELPTNQGGQAARTRGVNEANAKWIAFLDDDDEWMPEKLERQIEAATQSQHKFPIVSCHLLARTPKGEFIWPRRTPRQLEPLSEYLFVRNTLFQGEGLVQTSTILTAKALLQEVPFIKNLQRYNSHDDWDWLLRATTLPDVGLEFIPETLSVWDLGEKPSVSQSVSCSVTWQSSFNWIKDNRALVTDRAYSSFILSEVSSKAALTRDWKVFWLLLWEAIRFGNPQFPDLCLYVGMWLLSPDVRERLRLLLTSVRRTEPT